MNRVSFSLFSALLAATTLVLGGCSAGEGTKNTNTPNGGDDDSAGDAVDSEDGSGDEASVTEGIEIGCSGTKATGIRLSAIDLLAPVAKPVADAPVCTAQDAKITTVDYAEGEARPKCGPPALARWDGTQCEIVYQPGGEAKKVRCTGADCKALFSGEFGASEAETLAACEDAFAGCP